MSLVFYPTVAAIDGTGKSVAIPVHGCVFQANASLRVKTFGVLARTFKDEQEKQLFQERAKPFLVVSQKGKRVALKVDAANRPGSAVEDIENVEGWEISTPSRENGHFFDELQAPLEQLHSLGYAFDGRVSAKGPPTWITFSSKMLPDEREDIQDHVKDKKKEKDKKKQDKPSSTLSVSSVARIGDGKARDGDEEQPEHASFQEKEEPPDKSNNVQMEISTGQTDALPSGITPLKGSRREPREGKDKKKMEDREEKEAYFVGKAMLLEEEGISVVSDIDDTIKLSFVTDKPLFIKNTLLREFQAVPGMVDLYKSWEEELGARFHFVSGSPWQLWEPLCSFFEREGFPMGSVHLRKFNVTDKEMYKNSAKPQAERREEKRRKKRLHIEPLLEQFSKRKFIFVGDSGEEDPEVYAQLARKYPDQVKAIFIRRAPDSEKKVSKVVAQTMKRILKEEKEKEKRARKEKKEQEKQTKLMRKSTDRGRKPSSSVLVSSANRVNNSHPRVHRRTLSDPSMSSAFLKTLREEGEEAERWKVAMAKAKSGTPQKLPSKERKRKEIMGSKRRELKERVMEDKKELPTRRKKSSTQPIMLTYNWRSAEHIHVKDRNATIKDTSKEKPSKASDNKEHEKHEIRIKKEKQKNNGKKANNLSDDGEELGNPIPQSAELIPEPSNIPDISKPQDSVEVEQEDQTKGAGNQQGKEEKGGLAEGDVHAESAQQGERREVKEENLGSKQALHDVASVEIGQQEPRPVSEEKLGVKKGLSIPYNIPKKEVRWRTQELRTGSNLLKQNRFGSREDSKPSLSCSKSPDASHTVGLEYLQAARRVYRDEKKREKEKEKMKEKEKNEWLEMDEELELEDDEGGDEGEQKLLDELYHSRREQEDKRWQELFGGLEGVIWRVFEDPTEIRELPLHELLPSSCTSSSLLCV